MSLTSSAEILPSVVYLQCELSPSFVLGETLVALRMKTAQAIQAPLVSPWALKDHQHPQFVVVLNPVLSRKILACYLEAGRLSDIPLLLFAPLGQMPFPGGPVAVGDLSRLTWDLEFVL